MKIYAIDLGLTVKWADRNLYAKSIKDRGQLMSWGTPKEKGSLILTSDFSGDSVVDVVENDPDIKDGWRMPTKEEFEELVNKCTWKWDGENKTYTVTGPNGNSIQLPATGHKSASTISDNEASDSDNGYYWSISTCEGIPIDLFFDSNTQKVGISKYAWHTRQAIRPVLP